MVSGMAASLRFYVDGLGFEKTRDAVEWCWLERDGVALMLQVYRAPGKPGVGLSIWFQCEDALALYRQFVAKGLTPQKPCVGNNLWMSRSAIRMAIRRISKARPTFRKTANTIRRSTDGSWQKRRLVTIGQRA